MISVKNKITWRCVTASLLGPLLCHALPYTVKSDQSFFYKAKHQAIFTGHVVTHHGNSKMTGNKTVLFLSNDNKKVIKLINCGRPATYTTRLKHKKERLNGKADTIKYYPVTALVVFKHHAMITQAANSISGELISLDLNQETLHAYTPVNTAKRTKIIIHPEVIR